MYALVLALVPVPGEAAFAVVGTADEPVVGKSLRSPPISQPRLRPALARRRSRT
ncbi:MAG: hypothetical protein U0792_17690 [Gemmataceae bacterium]